MTLLIYFLKHVIMRNGLKMKNKEESVDLSDMSSLEGDEEVKEGTGLKVLTSNKLLTTFSILLAKIKAGNNPNKLKNEMLYLYRQIQANTVSFVSA